MRFSPMIVVGVLCWMSSVLAAGPPHQTVAVKPPWQRLLKGTDLITADTLEKKLNALEQAGRFADALKVAEELAALRSKVQGGDHWESVDARMEVETFRRVLGKPKELQKEYSHISKVQQQALAMEAKGQYSAAQPLRERILKINLEVLGEQHPDTAISYGNLASNQNAQSKYRDAENNFRKALAICLKRLGEEHPNTATCYDNLAGNFSDQGNSREAEKGYRKALAIRCKVLGEEDAATAISYNNLAFYQNSQGNYAEADENYRKALPVYRKALGEEHPETATCYENLAANQNALGKYSAAEKQFRKALAIRRKVLGEEHPDTASSYNGLAFNQFAQGKYHEAEEGFRRALMIRRKMLGENHADTATSYDNLAASQSLQGKYREAEEQFQRALNIRRSVLGEDHADTALSYSNLAYNQYLQSKYPAAEAGFRNGLSICQKALGEAHPATALAYDNLALSLSAQRKYREADEDFRQALAIRRKVLGEKHRDTATSYEDRAANQHAQGRYREAEEGYRTALAIFLKVLGEHHADTARCYAVLAGNQNAQGRYCEAQELWLHAADAFRQARLQVAATGLERAPFGSKYSPLPRLAAVLARNGQPIDAWQRYEESLARGIWDDLSTRLRIPQADRDRQLELSTRIGGLHRRLAQAKSEQSQVREQLLTALRRQYDALAAFSRELETKYGPVAGEVYGWTRIQQTLPPDAALVGWLDFPGRPQAADPNGEHWALLLRSAGPPICVRLTGSGAHSAWTETDTRLPGRLRAALQRPYSDWQPLARRLYRQRFEPLQKHLQQLRHLIVLPSTALAGVPVEVFANGYTVSYAHSGTMYAYLRQQPRPTSQGLLAVADPAFEPPPRKNAPLPSGGVLVLSVLPGSQAARVGLQPNDVLLRYGDSTLSGPADLSQAMQKAHVLNKRVPLVVWRDGHPLSRPLFVPPDKLGVVLARVPARVALAANRDLQQQTTAYGEHWPRLEGSRFEAAALQRLFAGQPATVLLRARASEQKLNELARAGTIRTYRYVHLASHGEMNNTRPLRSAVILAQNDLPDPAQRVQLLQAGEPIPDGRLTAEEVLQHWHLDCELVTLSACQTALGKYEGGEGFVGFAQALALAGSRTVCLSLWKVDDTATALLMQRFYQNLLGKRKDLHAPLGNAAALAEAKHWLRQLTRDEALQLAAHLSDGVPRGKPSAPRPLGLPAARAQTGRPFAHPYYWAAFVLIGRAD